MSTVTNMTKGASPLKASKLQAFLSEPKNAEGQVATPGYQSGTTRLPGAIDPSTIALTEAINWCPLFFLFFSISLVPFVFFSISFAPLLLLLLGGYYSGNKVSWGLKLDYSPFIREFLRLPGFSVQPPQHPLSPQRALLCLTLAAIFASVVSRDPSISMTSAFACLLTSHTCFAFYVWALSQKDRNALIHALNGNIAASAAPVKDFKSSPIRALGGVRHLLTEAVVSMVSPYLSTAWTPTTFPSQAIDLSLNLTHSDREIIVTERTSAFTRHFPKTMAVTRNAEFFEEKLKSIFAYVYRPEAAYQHLKTCLYDRFFEPRIPSHRPLQQRYERLRRALAGDLDRDALMDADRVLALNRFLDTRGNRQVAAWEASQWTRWLGISQFLLSSDKGASWAECAFRLWSRYYACQWQQEEYRLGQLRPSRQGTPIALTHINATPVLGPNAPNPEAQLWEPEAQAGLADGRKLFVDAEEMSEPELIELLTCLVPTENEDRLFLEVTFPEVTRQNGGEGPVQVNPRETKNFLFNPLRYTFDNGVDEIFIHYGNQPLPDAAALNRIQQSIFAAPQKAHIAAVLRRLCVKHAAHEDVRLGLEAVMFRTTAFASGRMSGKRSNLGAHQYIAADGSNGLHLPRLRTGAAYFDVFREPAPLDDFTQHALALEPRAFIHSAALMCQARAVSLNWAAYATSLLGAQWASPPGQALNSFIRNHVDVWLRKYATESVNLWSGLHANAMATQFGFAPREETRATDDQTTLNWWGDYQAPYLSNPYLDLWMMQTIPSHQILPFYDEEAPATTTWEKGRPQPASDSQSFQAFVELGRDLSPFSGRTWMADGGMTRNAQFYVAQGDGADFRFEGTEPNVELVRWASQYVHQSPQLPAGTGITWMAPAGSPFADFILPGSMAALHMRRNRVYAWGARRTGENNQSIVNHRWYYNSLQRPFESLMVNYVHPVRIREDVKSLHDYSIIIWQSGNQFAGMTNVRYDVPDVAAGARFDPGSIPPMPNYDIPVSSSDPFRANVEGQTTTAAVNRITARSVQQPPLERIQAHLAQRENAVTPDLAYKAKYPTHVGQVPRLPVRDAVVTGEGIAVDSYPSDLHQVPHTRLEQIQAAMDTLMDEEEVIISEQAAQLQRSREGWAAQQRTAASERPQRRPRARYTQPSANTYVRPNQQVHTPAFTNAPPHSPVEPNDSAAPQVQSGFVKLGEEWSNGWDREFDAAPPSPAHHEDPGMDYDAIHDLAKHRPRTQPTAGARRNRQPAMHFGSVAARLPKNPRYASSATRADGDTTQKREAAHHDSFADASQHEQRPQPEKKQPDTFFPSSNPNAPTATLADGAFLDKRIQEAISQHHPARAAEQAEN
uniref:Uncharacterized protein n=1 Tax=Diplodia fraxini fusagravirus 1a TaxID=3074314 RepID=A0AA51YMZ9_9VIRU|nr:hypothetical protein [Diplodia fraxini fusagravirus 1a]